MIKIKKGINLPLNGMPRQTIDESKKVKTLAIIGDDYKGMKPRMLVEVGDQVKIGDKLFEDKKRPGVFITSPGAGDVIEINRGKRRKFETLVIKLNGDEQKVSFDNYKNDLRQQLIESGLWTALRTRPFDKTPHIDSKPNSIFVTAMDTNPLCLDAEMIIKKYVKDFWNGVSLLKKLTEGNIFVCTKNNSELKNSEDRLVVEQFAGPHPAGNAGTHIQCLDSVSEHKTVWHIGYQDVIAISKLVETGTLWTDRYIAITGPRAENPRIFKTRLGVSIDELCASEIQKKEDTRIISGSVFEGTGHYNEKSFLGRFHRQITLLEEGNKRELFGWAMPGGSKISLANIFISKLFCGKKIKLTTDYNGSHRNIVPIGTYEKVLPGDYLATPLLKTIMSKDIEEAIHLGCLELAEEDLATCTFVCPGKTDFGKNLRDLLEIIEKEG